MNVNMNANVNAQDPLQAVLERLGLTPVAANEFLNNGVIDAYSFRMLTTEDLNRLIKQIHRDNQGAGLLIPFMSQQYIHALHFWINRQYILGRPHPLETFDIVQAMYWRERMQAETGEPADLVKTPEPYKKDTKWKSWKESVCTYLHSKKGLAGIPLAAIIRENDIPTPGVAYATAHDELVECSILDRTLKARRMLCVTTIRL